MSKSKSQIAKLEAAVQAQKEEAEEKEKVLNEGEAPWSVDLTMTCVELRNIICLHRNISTETTERAVASSHS